ncbi:hypothetical protein CYLTODRAFT_486847 [Cylindrobasidium torrendii FP15055 ss-10]|uniref:F-box domain-containing protein n=1 Tax=Cylindrobasidium torrendii FP15055 ss-10 TaxID=1314674 RepID=A0A0D7BMX2_9AGAR|nr:hypothetical protein CYLTODRAFT_486847 [Cylindrobasidium torrendii FP15055 ss-10]
MDMLSLALSTFDTVSTSGNDSPLDLKARIVTLRRILGKSASNRDELVAKIALIDGLLKNTHIRDLPVEIMSEIFTWCIFSSLKDSLYNVIRLIPLQRVCRRWRDVISSEPCVQNTIRVPMPPHLDSLLTEYPDSQQVSYWQAFSYQLSRTRNDVPLRILAGGTQVIYNSPEYIHPFNDFLLHFYYLLLRTSHVRLVFRGTEFTEFSQVMPLPTVDVPLPQMRYLDWNCNLFPCDNVNAFLKNASGLQVLKLRTRLTLKVVIPTLRDFYFNDGMLSEFLPYMPSLSYVECRCYDDYSSTPVLHKKLQTMRVLEGTPFAAVTLPALKDLCCGSSGFQRSDHRGFWPTSEDIAFFERSNCQLRRLVVTTPTLMAGFFHIFSSQNSLHYLYLTGDSGVIGATYHAVVAYIRAGHHPLLKEGSFTGTRAPKNPWATWVPWEWCIEAAQEGMLHVDSEVQLWPQDTGTAQSGVDLLVRSLLRKA